MDEDTLTIRPLPAARIRARSTSPRRSHRTAKAAAPADGVDQSDGRLGVADIQQRDARAVFGQPHRDSLPDSGGRVRNDGHLALFARLQALLPRTRTDEAFGSVIRVCSGRIRYVTVTAGGSARRPPA